MAQAEPAIPKPVAPPIRPAPVVAENPGPQLPPPPPPIPLKFFGFANQQGARKVFLSSGDDVFVAGEGEIVQRRYKIMRVNQNNIEVQDVLNNNVQTIPLTSG
jgi:ribosome-associated protein YbcJ (S4-like RNA binding protein)